MIALNIVLTLLFAGGMTVLLVVGTNYRKKARRFEKISATPAGYIIERCTAKVVGTVASLGRTLWSPLSNRECVYYRLLIEESRNDDRDWRVIIDDVQSVAFSVKDETGRVNVETREFDIDIQSKRRVDLGFLADLSKAKEERLCNQYPGRKLSFTRNMRFKEIVVELGDMLAVTGDIDLPKSGPPTFRVPKKGPVCLSDEIVIPEAERNRKAALMSFICGGVSGVFAIVFASWLMVVATSPKKKSLDDQSGTQANVGNNSPRVVDQRDIAPIGGVPFGGAPIGGAPFGGVPIGGAPFGGAPFGGAPDPDYSNDLDSIVKRINGFIPRGEMAFIHLELMRIRDLDKPGYKRRADVKRFLLSLSTDQRLKAQPNQFTALLAWQELLKWMQKEDSLELCELLVAEQDDMRRDDIFRKLKEFKDVRCAPRVVPFLAAIKGRGEAVSLLQSFDSSIEKLVVPYLAANLDKDTRIAAMDVLDKIGTAESAKIIETIILDREFFVSATARRIHASMSKRLSIERDALDMVQSFRNAIAAQNAIGIVNTYQELDKAYKRDHPQRAEVFKALIEICKTTTGDGQGYAYRGVEKWSSAGDVEALCDLLIFSDGHVLVFRKLLECKDPRSAEAVARFLPDFSKQGSAIGILQAIGAPAEKSVIPYARKIGPNGAVIEFGSRVGIIKLLGEIGTKASIPVLQQISQEFEVKSTVIDALNKIAARAKKK